MALSLYGLLSPLKGESAKGSTTQAKDDDLHDDLSRLDHTTPT